MRRPARLERAGALTPRDRIWSAIRRFGRVGEGDARAFSVVEIMTLSGQRDDTALSYLRALEKAGYVSAGGEAPLALRRRREFRCFRLVRDVGVDAPRVKADGSPAEENAGREQMWRAVRILREFDFRELSVAASTEEHPVAPDEAQSYMRFLKLGGYLAVARPARSGNQNPAPERLRFIRSRNTGPRAPLVTREKSVLDGNSGAVVYEARQ